MGCSQSKQAKHSKPAAKPQAQRNNSKGRDVDGSPSSGGITAVVTSAGGSGTGTRNTSKDDIASDDVVGEMKSSGPRSSVSHTHGTIQWSDETGSRALALHQIGIEISSSKALGAHAARSQRMERLAEREAKDGVTRSRPLESSSNDINFTRSRPMYRVHGGDSVESLHGIFNDGVVRGPDVSGSGGRTDERKSTGGSSAGP